MADGAVRVWFTEPQHKEIQGRLMDISTRGFRMTHQCPDLEAGQVVKFSHPEAAGQARVIWNRILAARVETGFLLVP